MAEVRGEGATSGEAMPEGGRRWGVHVPTIVVLVVGLLVTAVLSVAARAVHERDEDRLVRQRVLAASSVLVSAVPAIQARVAAAAELVEETDASPAAFRRAMAPHIGEEQQFVGASVWRVDGEGPLVAIGDPKLRSRSDEERRALFESAVSADTMAVVALLDGADARIGYAMTSALEDDRFVVYAEQALPPNRTAVPQQNEAFTGLDYAVYLGRGEDSATVLLASTPDLPLEGRRSADDIEFGDSNLHLVMAARETLGSVWIERAWWLVGALGLLLTAGAAALTERLMRGRERAERLSAENARLYAQQRSVAQTLQHSMLPDVLPKVDGIDIAVRYVPGVEGVDVGGDWYDVMTLDDHRLLVVVGDVSGRGLGAATVMAALRYAIRAYAAQGDDPATILEKLGRLVSVGRDGHFATVLCAIVDGDTGTVTLASAGHPPPAVADGSGCEFVSLTSGVPVGVSSPNGYATTTLTLPPGGTLLAFTDGLVERRGETLDEGFERVRRVTTAARDGAAPVDDLLARLVDELMPNGSDDDTAILGLRWTR